MSDVEIDRRLPSDVVQRMVQLVRPDWEMATASLAEDEWGRCRRSARTRRPTDSGRSRDGSFGRSGEIPGR